MEKQISAGTTYLDCFKGVDRRRTEIVMMVFAGQLLSGQNLIGSGVQFLQQAGIDTNLAFSLNMVLNAQFVIGTIASWALVRRVRRVTANRFSHAYERRYLSSAVARFTSAAWRPCRQLYGSSVVWAMRSRPRP